MECPIYTRPTAAEKQKDTFKAIRNVKLRETRCFASRRSIYSYKQLHTKRVAPQRAKEATGWQDSPFSRRPSCSRSLGPSSSVGCGLLSDAAQSVALPASPFTASCSTAALRMRRIDFPPGCVVAAPETTAARPHRHRLAGLWPSGFLRAGSSQLHRTHYHLYRGNKSNGKIELVSQSLALKIHTQNSS